MPALFADVTFSTEALVVVVALVGALWAWSVSLVQSRTRDLIAALERQHAENKELRRQNEGLYGQLLNSQREVRALRDRLPGD